MLSECLCFCCLLAAPNKSKSWRERECERRVCESVCVLTLSRNSEETRLIASVAFLLFSRVVTAVAALGYYVSRAPMAENTPFPSPAAPQTPDCEKSLGGSYGSSGLLSAGRPERRSVLGVLWSHSFHSLSGFVSIRPQQHNSPLRGKDRERHRKRGDEGRGEAWGKLHPCLWKRKHLGGRRLDVFWLWCVSYLWWWWCERGSGVLEHERNR